MFEENFNFAEVIEMAKDIEKKGFDFYQNQARKTDNNELEILLLKLAEDEKDHYDTFVKIEAQAKKRTDLESEYIYNEEVSAYLNAIIEFAVFPAESEVEDKFKTIEDILDLAIRAEKDSILFYREMLDHNEGQTAKMLRRLIKEEKQHLLDLVKYNAEKA
jgi:rubrerythrin